MSSYDMVLCMEDLKWRSIGQVWFSCLFFFVDPLTLPWPLTPSPSRPVQAPGAKLHGRGGVDGGGQHQPHHGQHGHEWRQQPLTRHLHHQLHPGKMPTHTNRPPQGTSQTYAQYCTMQGNSPKASVCFTIYMYFLNLQSVSTNWRQNRLV